MSRRLISSLATGALVLGAVAGFAPAASATSPAGTTSLAEVLLADGDQFDRNWYDYDIVTEAVLALLAAKPDSAVGVLTDGTVPLTAFIPNDRAFQVLVWDLTKRWVHTEAKVFEAVAGLGIDAVEQVLLYHVVPGATIDSATALTSNGAKLTTAQGGTFTVSVLSKKSVIVRLKDQDRNDLDPFLNRRALDINVGNVQIAHGITLVLRPFDL